ncbi:MAG: DJ-1/PfpI family protein [Planctomycetes bacterium]|nr:DJ-1/PfpI family protein [Planctomycetota bacterium]
MAAKKETKPGAELDADGLVVQKYKSVVLVIVPPADFAEQALRYARSSLYNVHVGTRSVSTVTQELVKGWHQDEFLVDEPIGNASMDAYSGLVLAGGAGALTIADDPDVQRLVREAFAQKKMVGACGEALAILARASVLKGRRVTGAPSLKAAIQSAGGRYSSRQVEVDGLLVTGQDDSAGMRYGKALAAIVGI